MTVKTKSTIKMLCVRSGIVNQELPQEAQRLMELYNDPNVSPEQKEIARRELDEAIRKMEERVETARHIRARKEL